MSDLPYEAHKGATYWYQIQPMIRIKFSAPTDGAVKAWRVRVGGELLDGKLRRADCWQLSIVPRRPVFDPTAAVPIPAQAPNIQVFPTLKAARAEAERLAKEDRTRALLKGE